MPRFKEMELSRRSVIWAMWSEQKKRARNREAGSGARWSLFVTLKGGMQELVDGLAQRLPETAVQINSPVGALQQTPGKNNWLISVDADKHVEADAVILATPAFRTGDLLNLVESAAAVELKNIPYASTATVSLAYRREDFPQAPNSFGFVVPAIEKRKIMACTFSSLKYPGRAPDDKILLRAFVGGSLQAELFKQDDQAMEEIVRSEIAALLGVTAAPIFARVWRHPDSMPQYHVGHDARIKRIETALSRFPTLALAGSAYHGVGISDCVRTGEEAAERILDQVCS